MKPFILSTLLCFACSYTTIAQQISAQTTSISLIADYPSGKVEARHHAAVSQLDTESGWIHIEAMNQAFQPKSVSKAAKASLLNQSSTKLKAQITNIKSIDFTKEGQQTARIIGRFIFNGVASTFYDKGQLIIENGKITLSLNIEVSMADHEVEGSQEKDLISMEVLVDWNTENQTAQSQNGVD